ncbi:MAG: NAD-dependent epimerase/dehydratase family protein [Henriciella sp.]|nr:NAD-dependent epimerase/dehydratase family protein [Hyphomonadaceae bacterium]
MTILITGVAGFIGAHVAQKLLAEGRSVIGFDNLNDYYSSKLKRDRLETLCAQGDFSFQEVDVAAPADLRSALSDRKPTKILHLAAQAGVRYSLQNPAAYTKSNLEGHFAMLELAKSLEVENMVYASSSSVYGGNTKIPFAETDQTDDPVSFYGATKKSNELMSQSYARLYGFSLTGLRFFTVYGPWGRPDMAYWIFAEKILRGEPIRVFNHGKMSRDFTFIDDIVDGTIAALDRPASRLGLSVPHRVYNLGNDRPEPLMDLIRLTEQGMGQVAEKDFGPMQKGDLEKTWADIQRARTELGFDPRVGLQEGLTRFTAWFKDYWTRYRQTD